MDEFINKKNKIEEQISDILLKEIENDKLTAEDALIITDYCIPKTKAINTEEELLVFLSEISVKWPMFSNLVVFEQGAVKEETKNETVANITDLVNAGNIDEALNLAKSANN